MTSGGVETTALLALACAEMATNDSAVGERTNGSEIFSDLDNDNERISLLTFFASASLTPFDWNCVRALRDYPGGEELPGLLMEVEPRRAEAILHAAAAALAAGEEGHAIAVPADLALVVLERWEEVEEAMNRWRALGIGLTREDLWVMYVPAVMEATGKTRDDVVDDFWQATESSATSQG